VNLLNRALAKIQVRGAYRKNGLTMGQAVCLSSKDDWAIAAALTVLDKECGSSLCTYEDLPSTRLRDVVALVKRAIRRELSDPDSIKRLKDRSAAVEAALSRPVRENDRALHRIHKLEQRLFALENPL
jgi:hypothetical protein